MINLLGVHFRRQQYFSKFGEKRSIILTSRPSSESFNAGLFITVLGGPSINEENIQKLDKFGQFRAFFDRFGEKMSDSQLLDFL